MPKLLNPTDFGFNNLPLEPVRGKPKRCDDCGELVTEKRWSPYWCPDHDILRMKRIDDNLTKFMEGYGLEPSAP